MSMSGRRTVVVVATGAAWEAEALALLERERSLVLLKRCVDVDDLIATAATGQADVALVGLEAPGLDADAVARVQQAGTLVIGVLAGDTESAQARGSRIGVRHLVGPDRLREALTVATTWDASAPASTATPGPVGPDAARETLSADPVVPDRFDQGRTLVVWGTAGAPGRSTVATAIAADLARRGSAVTLIDADPAGGTIAQQLGVLEEVSGLLAAGRMSTAGTLEEAWERAARAVDDRLWVITGLPLPERWREVPVGAIDGLVAAAASRGWVVLDVGAGLDRDRDRLTLEALEAADEVVVVATPDPVGLSRMARALTEVTERVGAPIRVVLNQHRRSLHTTEVELADLVGLAFGSLGAPVAVHVLPEDRAGADAALLAHRAVGAGTAPIDRALQRLAAAIAPPPVAGARRRRAGTARRR